MSLRSTTQSAIAMARLQECRAVGTTGTFTDHSGSVTVYLRPLPASRWRTSGIGDGGITGNKVAIFTVPMQTGFPPTGGFSGIGQKLVVGSDTYAVVNVETEDEWDAVYVLTCEWRSVWTPGI